jgi:hypothetical protein
VEAGLDAAADDALPEQEMPFTPAQKRYLERLLDMSNGEARKAAQIIKDAPADSPGADL